MAETPRAISDLRKAGNRALSCGKYKEALKFLRHVAETEPKNPQVLEGIARAFAAQRKFELATKFANRALEIDPARSMAHLVLGGVYRVKKQFAESEKEIEKVLRSEQNSGRAHCSLAELHLERKNPGKALVEARKAVTLGFDQPQVHYLLGVIYSTLRDHRRALSEFRQVLRSQPLSLTLRIASVVAIFESHLARIWALVSVITGLLILLLILAPLWISLFALVILELVDLYLTVGNLAYRPKWSLLFLFFSGLAGLFFYLAHFSPWAWAP